MEELKPCPFCGGNVGIFYFDEEHQNEKRWEECDDDNGCVFPYIHCQDCDATICFSSPYPTGKSVIKSWNRRANDD